MGPSWISLSERSRYRSRIFPRSLSNAGRSVSLDGQRSTTTDPLLALRDMLGDVCRHWAEHEDTMRELLTLSAITGTEPPGDGVDEKHLRRLVEGLGSSGQLRSHWSTDEAVDALAVLTSYATYERLRRAPRPPEQVESVLAKLAVAVVTPHAMAAPN